MLLEIVQLSAQAKLPDSGAGEGAGTVIKITVAEKPTVAPTIKHAVQLIDEFNCMLLVVYFYLCGLCCAVMCSMCI